MWAHSPRAAWHVNTCSFHSSQRKHPWTSGRCAATHTLISSPASPLSTTLLSYDQCYVCVCVCAMKHKVALFILLLRALRRETLSLTPLEKQTGPCTRPPEEEPLRPEFSC